MPDPEVERLNNIISTINAQLDELASLSAVIAKWPESDHKQDCLGKIFAQQDAFKKRSKGIFDHLRKHGAIP